MMSASEPHVTDDCRGVLRVFSDGSFWRSPNPSFPIAVNDDGSIEWKDLPFGPSDLDLHLRLYRPKTQSPFKLPIFYYFHGGGFCIGSRTWPNCQNYCFRLAGELNALIVAPDYRLAPEHLLPAALTDGVAAVDWLRSQAESPNPDPWLAESADFSQVFISGDSAGGNIAHHLAVRFAKPAGSNPVRIRGYVLLMPFFGGTPRTKSEAECPKDAFLNQELNDSYWRLSLPRGATVDDPMVNPFGPGGPDLGSVRFEPMLVVVGERDLLRDRAAHYARRLKDWGKPVELVEFEGQQHGFFTIEPWSEPADVLMDRIKLFMEENGSD